MCRDRYERDVQARDVEHQCTVSRRDYELGEELDLPVLANNETHFLARDDHNANDILLCIGLGKDFSDFATGLRAALRQAPKVILVGEIRDSEKREIALIAAEPGHKAYVPLQQIRGSASIILILGMSGRA